MRRNIALFGMVAILAWFLIGIRPCDAAKLADSQIQAIQANIHISTDLSSKCLENHNIADQNHTIALSNYQKTNIQGFRQAAEIYAESQAKFLETRRLFDDAWIQMQLGMVNDDFAPVKKGTDLHNIAAQRFNEATLALNRAAGIFNQAIQESQSRSGPASTVPIGRGRIQPVDIASGWGIPDFSPSNMPRNGFPAAALIILIGTVATSIQAFKDERVTDRYILHPWSILRHKTRYYSLITNGLIHADPMHLTMNLMSFSFFALPLEGIIGHQRFVLVYLGSLFLSSLVVVVRHGNEAYYRCLGASGAISGVIFSYIIYRPNAKISMMLAPVGVPAPIFALFYVGYSYYMSKAKYDNVAHDAHLWGAIAGAMITVVLDPRLMSTLTSSLH